MTRIPAQPDAPGLLLDLSTWQMTALFASAPLYVKSAAVHIREVPVGTVAPTVLADGTHETTITASEDRRHEVTNPDGERYLITAEKVTDRYTPLGDGRYQARDAVRAFANPVAAPIRIVEPWGTEQHGGPDVMLAVAVDPASPDVIGADRYLIGRAEFARTYAGAVAVRS